MNEVNTHVDKSMEVKTPHVDHVHTKPVDKLGEEHKKHTKDTSKIEKEINPTHVM